MFFDQYIPHIQSAAGKCQHFGVAVLSELQAIRLLLEENTRNVGMEDIYQRITINALGATLQELTRVPPGQIWEIQVVTGTAPWSMLLGGVPLLNSANNLSSAEAVMLPGETWTFSPSAAGSYAIHLKRTYVPDPVAPAKSGPEGNWVNGTGPRHEANRDIMDIGVPVRTPVATGEN